MHSSILERLGNFQPKFRDRKYDIPVVSSKVILYLHINEGNIRQSTGYNMNTNWRHYIKPFELEFISSNDNKHFNNTFVPESYTPLVLIHSIILPFIFLNFKVLYNILNISERPYYAFTLKIPNLTLYHSVSLQKPFTAQKGPIILSSNFRFPSEQISNRYTHFLAPNSLSFSLLSHHAGAFRQTSLKSVCNLALIFGGQLPARRARAKLKYYSRVLAVERVINLGWWVAFPRFFSVTRRSMKIFDDLCRLLKGLIGVWGWI